MRGEESFFASGVQGRSTFGGCAALEKVFVAGFAFESDCVVAWFLDCKYVGGPRTFSLGKKISLNYRFGDTE